MSRTVTIEDRHSPNRLLDEINKHVADARIAMRVGLAPHRRQGMRRAGKEKMVGVGDSKVIHPGALMRHVHGRDRIQRHFRRRGQLVDPTEGFQVRSVRLLLTCNNPLLSAIILLSANQQLFAAVHRPRVQECEFEGCPVFWPCSGSLTKNGYVTTLSAAIQHPVSAQVQQLHAARGERSVDHGRLIPHTAD